MKQQHTPQPIALIAIGCGNGCGKSLMIFFFPMLKRT